ncbi:SagB-type dehydrogenase domain-containing protein [Alteromonadaceae bacterium Bs31]|nr:SagB-type dehydrogenase domain-containing protein [Alteromonadaceae bacterium Bs31]
MESWSLRNNPSSGNLHPTESYIILWAAVDDELVPGIYHYAPYEHGLERRAVIDKNIAKTIYQENPGCFGALALSSIHWREEWKYGVRALRYCQLDVGHALGAGRYSAALQGWRMALDTRAGDGLISECLG